jgi:hypothetical protein
MFVITQYLNTCSGNLRTDEFHLELVPAFKDSIRAVSLGGL